MRTFVAAVISVLVLAGCTSNAPAWWGSTGEPQYGYQSPPSRLRATQVLGARVRNDIAVSGARGADTSVALNYQARGDDALSRGELTMAAEQYGRAEEALT